MWRIFYNKGNVSFSKKSLFYGVNFYSTQAAYVQYYRRNLIQRNLNCHTNIVNKTTNFRFSSENFSRIVLP
jgi:hypothetical protein